MLTETFRNPILVDMTTTQKTQPLTAIQAQTLNTLSRTCADLRTNLKDLIARAKEQEERVLMGHHMSGFDGDLLGQVRYNADANAVKRTMLITSSYAVGAPIEAVTMALLKSRQRDSYSGAHYFTEGDTFDIDPELRGEAV